jgi:hypothetical protein
MTWQIVQTGAELSGTFSMADTETGFGAQGTVTGSVSGSTVKFSLDVPVGGAEGPWAACSIRVAGELTAGDTSMTGMYSGSNSCSGPVTGGQVTLEKQ